MADARVPNPLVEQFIKGGVARELRLMASQGALPLKTVDLVELLHHLLRDPEPDIAASAEKTLKGMPSDELRPVFQARDTPPAVLGWAVVHHDDVRLREPLLQNPSTPDDAIQEVAGRLPEGMAELVVINQTRLLRSTPLLVALESNPSLNNDQRRRLRELRESFHIGETPAPTAAPAPGPEPPPPPPPPPEPEPEPLKNEQEAVDHYLSEEERNETEKLTAVQRLYRMNTAEKVVAALKGSREERAVLVRDRNRIVCTAVLGSPKLTEAEVEQIAGMKNVSDDVLRTIGGNRDWIKRYSVVLNLVKNPRTPVGVSLGMVSRLNPRDMRALTTDRNVSEVIRKQAQKFIKGQQSGGGGKH
jgi:hypothetical protein